MGKIATSIKQTTLQGVNNEKVILLIGAEGIWAKQFSESSKSMLTVLIAGKKITDAQSLLMHHVGIAKADIQINGIFANTLPNDLGRITIVVQSVHGL